MYNVKEIHDFALWDKFVETSPQGTLFSSTKWCQLFNDPFSIYGCYKGEELQGGLIGFHTDKGFFSGGYPVTQFQGILLKPGLEDKYSITEELIKSVPDKATILNSYLLPDIRPMLWEGWKPIIRYTYVIKNPDIARLEKDTRYDILHDKQECWDGTVSEFYPLYGVTFKRKKLLVPVSFEWMLKFADAFNPSIKMTPSNAAMTIEDNKRAYYIFGASDGSKSSARIVWEAIKDKPEVDTVGANNKEIALYKRGFGGCLTPYLGATNE